MVKQYKPYSLPEGVDVAALRLAAIANAEGVHQLTFGVINGVLYNFAVIDRDGTKHHLVNSHGQWLEVIEGSER